LPIEVNPVRISGSWDDGYCLDRHTISSTMIGYNEFGHPEFDTQRSALGELIYRLKYKGDVGTIPSIVETAAHFIREWRVSLDLIIPMPPSKQRLMQPVFEIVSALASTLEITVDTKSVSKTSSTLQMKDIGDYSARVVALESTIKVEGDLNGKRVLLVGRGWEALAFKPIPAFKSEPETAMYFNSLLRVIPFFTSVSEPFWLDDFMDNSPQLGVSVKLEGPLQRITAWV
jgi:competence protein ComFC